MVKIKNINLDNIEKIGIVVIQSLKENDRKTGFELFDGIVKYKSFQEESFSREFKEVISKDELLNYFKELIHRIETEKFYFILHLETHGNQQGIVLKNGEVLLWDELFCYTRSMNTYFEGNLVLGLAMCYGGAILSAIPPDNRAPFKFFIGAFRSIDPDEIIRGFEQFYENFFFSFSPTNSLNSMNTELNPDEKTFYVVDDELIFNAICDPDRDPKGFAEIVDNLYYSELETNPNIKRETIENNIRNLLSATYIKYRDLFCFKDIKRED